MPKKEKIEKEEKLVTESKEQKKKTVKKTDSKNNSKKTVKAERNKESKVESVKDKEKKQNTKKVSKTITKKKAKEENGAKVKAEASKKTERKNKTKKVHDDEVAKVKTEKNKTLKIAKKDEKVVAEVNDEQKELKNDENVILNTSEQEQKVLETKKVTTKPKTKSKLPKNNRKEASDLLNLEIRKKEFRTLEVVVLVLLTCIISLIVGLCLGTKIDDSKKVQNDNEIKYQDKALQNFIKEYNYLIENYYGTVDKEELLNTAIKSMVDSLDDSYTGSLDETTSNNLEIELNGTYEGLGIEIINDSNNDIFIYSVIPNSPASQVDLQVNDKLISVNGANVTGMVTTNFINNIVKGSGATKFSITIERNGIQKTVELVKNKITLQSVHSKIYKENGKKTIGYIHASVFAANTYEQFKSELTKLENQGIDSLIIDLRDNNGGHLTAVRDMIGLFLDSSHVIYQTQTKTQTQKTYSSGKQTKKYPIAIVGNALSASASEVMIGALMEEYGAVLIGNQTFGKGTVQELHTLSNGDEYKLTTKKWLTPKGVWVHNNGIKPTIEVTLAKEFYSNPVEENDNQLRAALDYLKNLK